MYPELFLGLGRRLTVHHHEPIIAAQHLFPIGGPVPSLSRRADLPKQLPVAVKDINFCARLPRKAHNVPGLVATVTVGGKKVRVVQQRNSADGSATILYNESDGYH